MVGSCIEFVNKGAHWKTSFDQQVDNVGPRRTLLSTCRAGYQYPLRHRVFSFGHLSNLPFPTKGRKPCLRAAVGERKVRGLCIHLKPGRLYEVNLEPLGER